MSEPSKLVFENREAAQEAAHEMPGEYAIIRVTNGWQVAPIRQVPMLVPKPLPRKTVSKLDLAKIVGDDAAHFDLPLIGESRNRVQVRLPNDAWLTLMFDSLTAYEYAPGDMCLRFKFTVPRRWASQRGIVKFAINCKDNT